MRINCEVQVSNRKLPSLNISNKRSATRSSLGIGHLPGAKADVSNLFIQLCTALDKRGTKYKISGNIDAVFTKFVLEGKFTIRFKEPAHDLCVKADPVLAKSFLQTLKLGIQNKDIDKLHLSKLAPVKQSQIEKPKTKLTIASRKEYPLSSFPYSLESLKINDVQLNRIENRIIKLKRLQSLNLNNNLIKEIPTTVNAMHCLTELHLSFNTITHINHQLFQGRLSHTLQLLDLSCNEIAYLPHTLGKLQSLVTLKLSGNILQKLPVSLGKLTRLRYLMASNNKLEELPASIRYLKMDTLDVFGNPLSSRLGLVKNNIKERVPCLKETASAYCVQRRLQPTAADIPATLLEYLQAWVKCFCGKICYESHILACISLNLKLVASALTIGNVHQTSAPALATLCSQKCYDKFCGIK